jgi:uncharacterized membrane protein YfcA
MPDLLFLTLLFLAAVLYTSVGHAGASGYLAVMTFFDVAEKTMRPAALVLNIIASVPTTIQFVRAGHFDKRMFLACAAGSIPFAFLGSKQELPNLAFKIILATALIAAAIRMLWIPKSTFPKRTMPIWLGILLGIGIGYLAGLTGIGGGVYLTPIILMAGWAEPKKAAGVSSAFILVNSLAGILGRLDRIMTLPGEVATWAIAVLLGGLLGGTLGSRWLGSLTLRRLLAIVLLIAVIKLVGDPLRALIER